MTPTGLYAPDPEEKLDFQDIYANLVQELWYDDMIKRETREIRHLMKQVEGVLGPMEGMMIFVTNRSIHYGITRCKNSFPFINHT